MVDIVPGTHVRMRVIKRFSHYNLGELIAVDFWAAKELDAKRLAMPLDLLVPPHVAAATAEPVRQPASIVKK